MYVVYRHSYAKPRKAYMLKDISKIIGRTYTDFLLYVAKHRRAVVVQFDSVIGMQSDEAAILTVTWKEYDFQLGLLIRKGDPSSALSAIRGLMARFTDGEARELLGCCLCDNGTEFLTFYCIEERGGEKLCRTFYAGPYRATDKAECERCHEYIRYFMPKGKSMDDLTQDGVDEMMSNIDSAVRPSKGDRTPYELMERRFGKEIMDKMPARKIGKRKVVLKK
ncbi:MAG: hypothetical protein LKJ88_02820 [Bacilli bacterium]|jgi:IS30 family transposase|nr:hypothetical protein [Bacilli bacterium]